MKMSNCKYKLRKLSVGLVSVGIMFTATTVMGEEISQLPVTNVDVQQVVEKQVSVSDATSEAEKTEVSQDATSTQSEDTNTIIKSESKQVEEAKNSELAKVGSSEETSSNPSNQKSQALLKEEETNRSIEVDHFSIDKSTDSKIVKDDSNLITSRDKAQRTELFKIERNVNIDESKGEVDVTLTVTPKEIDNGADVIVLLDTSKKMTDEQFKNAKEGIKQLVTTLTGSVNDEKNRNTVRLIDFYREVGDPISLSGLSEENVNKKLDEVREKAYKKWNWGVDLQGAIHKAREIFKREANSNPSLKKHQHIVLFSQGEATFSYALGDEAKKKTSTVKGQITSSNATLSWLPIFDYTNRNANMIDDIKKLVSLSKNIGLDSKLGVVEKAVNSASLANGLLNIFGYSPTQYLTLKEYQSQNSLEKDFDYKRRVGEGYYNYSFSSNQATGDTPLKSILKPILKSSLDTESKSYFGALLDWMALREAFNKFKEDALWSVLDGIFYTREHIYYNHNLSAQAEARMAREEGITFFSFDVTKPNNTKKSDFDKYLKAMSEGNKLLDIDSVTNKDKFRYLLDNLEIKEEFSGDVKVKNDSWVTTLDSENKKIKDTQVVYHKEASAGSWLSAPTKESLTLKINKRQFFDALKYDRKIILNYKLELNKNKIKKNSEAKVRKTRSTEESKKLNFVSVNIISNTISYSINDKKVNGNKLEDIKLTYSKEMVPVPEVEGTIEIPKAPEKRLVDPVLPSQPVFPDMPKYDEAETSYGSSEIIDIVEDTGSGIEMGAASGAISTQENTDPIVEITEDTQPGMSGHSEDITIIEDTKPEKIDTIIGGNVIDFTEDSITHNQYTESGQNSTNESQEIIEDTKPESDTISIGGQSDPIEITEDTLPNVSGRSGDITITEDTKQPEVIIGGQSDPVELSEDTAPGMSGFNEGTVVEEDTRPKLQFHFDNEEPIPTINKAISQTPIARVDNNLPQTGDKDKSEAFFTIAALTVIGAAGLLSKKNRKNQID